MLEEDILYMFLEVRRGHYLVGERVKLFALSDECPLTR